MNLLTSIIIILEQSLKVKELFNETKTDRFYKEIIFDNDDGLNILLLLQNPSDDENSNLIFEQIIKKFMNDSYYHNNISKITIINPSSFITKKLERSHRELYKQYENENIIEITNLLTNNIYDEIYIGTGQHAYKACNFKDDFTRPYKKIISLIDEKQNSIIYKYFGRFVCNNTLAGYPARFPISLDVLNRSIINL